MPDKFEAGTHNIAGIFGLLGALEEPPEAGHSRDDWKRLISGIRQLKNMIFYGAENFDNQGPVFSIKHVKQDCAVLGRVLFDRLRIETRVGLHCAALAHKTLGTFPDGTVRIAPSRYHTGADFDYLLCGLEGIDRL
jgi:selenocysteine lyase/cysteine desulfurase